MTMSTTLRDPARARRAGIGIARALVSTLGPARALGLGLLALLLPAFAPAPLHAQDATHTDPPIPAQHAERVERIERSLVAPRLVAGRPVEEHTIQERLAHYGVPGASVAVIVDGRIAWAKGYGVRDVATGSPVTTGTLFQAASISKPVSVMGVLRLVEAGVLELDAPVDRFLTSWSVPGNGFDEPVTLRRLASHTAGTTVHGFPGYARSAEHPTTAGVLRGDGNTDPVVVDLEPGSAYRYSGGGTTILQLVVEDVTGRAFEDYMAEAVLEPIGMTRSTFAQPLPEDRWDDAATAYRASGAEVEEKWHVYPEKAAAGLWTTPTDLARLAIEVQRSLTGESNWVLSRAMTVRMLTPVRDGYGLGFGTEDSPTGRFGHGGANEGYRASLTAFRDGRGIAVMTNSDAGGPLAQEIMYAIGKEYGWDELGPRILTPFELSDARRDALAGNYALSAPAGARVTVTPSGDGLFRVVTHAAPAAPPSTLVPVSDTELVELVQGYSLGVVWDGDRVVKLIAPWVELTPVEP